MLDEAIFDGIIWDGEGASTLQWEVGTRCSCYTDESKQPQWGHEPCGGFGVVFADPVPVPALFRGQGRWLSFRREGELDHGEASISVPPEFKPGYVDRRVRDRYTVPAAPDDLAEGRVFYVAAPAVPFIFQNRQLAWRVQLQGMEQTDRVVPQP